jgi:hypothetical protein
MSAPTATLKLRSVKAEFGDFQTPPALAKGCCELLKRKGVKADSLIEPTCGDGNFLRAAIDFLPGARWGVGLEINPLHAELARAKLADAENFRVFCRSFFDFDWKELLVVLPDPLLVVGNPPWVTNSALGELNSANLPIKANFDGLRGMEALTGKSNFDISEWILISICDWLDGRNGALAMLCKTAVARKIFQRVAKLGQQAQSCGLYLIDAQKHFGAAVDACFLVVSFEPGAKCNRAEVYPCLDASIPTRVLAQHGDLLVGDADAYDRVRHLSGRCAHRWRSGLKHDCAGVMEVYPDGGRYRNGLGQSVDLEDAFLYPILKSSEVASGVCLPSRKVIVTQRDIGEPTDKIRTLAPKTWEYLAANGSLLDGRQSRIYKDKPRFSIFGVGPYSFSPWKIAISGLYKKLAFSLVGPYQGKPVMLDDTAYFLPFPTRLEAESVLSLLNSDLAKEFLSTQIFWDAKRPITSDLLGRLNIDRLASELGVDIEHAGNASLERPDQALLPLFA